MGWSRLTAALLPVALCALPGAASALTQVSGPVQIGPSAGSFDTQNHSATLSTMVTNQGGLPDRLMNITCPSVGDAHLLNGHVEPVDGVQRNGLDIPAAAPGRVTPVPVQISLTQARPPMVAGALVPCSLYFEHAGQRVVIFMLGEHEPASDEP